MHHHNLIKASRSCSDNSFKRSSRYFSRARMRGFYDANAPATQRKRIASLSLAARSPTASIARLASSPPSSP
jgi:hypothetical protein